jgi:ERCC4-type nuclease
MIYLDERVGSRDLLPLMPKNSAKLTRLEFGDIAFLGRGVDDAPVSIGIERKRLNDFLTSLTTGRLSGHQLPGLTNSYDVVYLLVEGLCRPNPRDGILETPRHKGWYPVTLGSRRFMAKELWSYLNTLQILAGVYVWKTGTARESAQWITNLYHWWNSKPMDAHKSHTLKHTPYAQLTVTKSTFVERMVAQLSGIGYKRAREVSKHFRSAIEVISATEREWTAIPGIGKILAKRIIEEIQNNDK